MADGASFVTVVVPVRNEERHLARCLDALAAQDYPFALLEVLIVDGMSTDGTRQIIEGYCRRYPHMRLLDNRQGIVPAGLNLGIREARGAVIVRVDGHCLVAPDYVSQCMDRLLHTDADNVGGRMRAVGEGTTGVGIALAGSSPFGVGNARFHYSRREEYVDTVYLGAYRREVFERIGLFDEELVRNQDDELNYRLRAAGGKILLSPRINSEYHGRSRLQDLFRQYFEYGLWKVRVAEKHPQSLQARHLAPAAFVAGLLALGLAGMEGRRARVALGLASFVYLATAGVFGLRGTMGRGRRYLPATMAAFACMHIGYGSGFLTGLARAVARRWRRG